MTYSFWCSTKVDDKLEHVGGGNWGYCRQSCPPITPVTATEESSECSVIETGSGLSKPCQFPFVYKEQSYDKCIYLDNEGNDLPWCSTRTDDVTNEHIGGGGHYGDCSEDLCPVILDEVEFVKWKDQNTVGKYRD